MEIRSGNTGIKPANHCKQQQHAHDPGAVIVERSLKKLREGDIVLLQGYLVDVDHESGWRWRTSMSRTDTGAGACEIVYVEHVAVET